MNSDHWFLASLAFYVLATALFAVVYRHVSANEGKYDSLLKSEAYRKSEWYWPAGKEYEKTDPPDNAGLAGAYVIVGLAIWQYVSGILIHFLNAKAWGLQTPFSAYNGFQALVLFGEIILSFVIGEWITMFSRRPIALTHGMTLFPKLKKSQACKKMTLIAASVFVLLYPLRIAGLMNCGAYDDTAVIYRAPFQLEATRFEFKDCDLITSEEPAVLRNAQGDALILREALLTDDFQPVAEEIIAAYQLQHSGSR